MAEANISKIEPINIANDVNQLRIPNNLVDNISKNVKFNELNNNVQNMGPPTINFTPEQIQIAQQMSNMMHQQIKQVQMQQPSRPSQSFQQLAHQVPVQKSILKDIKTENIGNNTVVPDAVLDSLTLPGSVDYYTLFGFQLSKTTVYILIGFILIIVAYIIYSKWFSTPKEEKKKKKKQTEVSYQEQEKVNQEE